MQKRIRLEIEQEAYGQPITLRGHVHEQEVLRTFPTIFDAIAGIRDVTTLLSVTDDDDESGERIGFRAIREEQKRRAES